MNPALTRDEAAQRGRAISDCHYRVTLDLRDGQEAGEGRFHSLSQVSFTATPGAASWIDLVCERIVAARLNGRALDLSGYDGQRLPLADLAGQNHLEVEAVCRYSRTGEGLHRLVDPVDGGVYLYSQFETADAQRVYACFDQPDLKATFTFTVIAPQDWEVISNSPTPTPEPVEPGLARWDFPTTARMSTYITAIVAGPYVAVRDTYTGPHGSYPLAVYARASMIAHLDHERVLAETKAGFAFFEDAFAQPYPFTKYDQVFVPEYNAGAMENAGCVTIVEDYVFRSRVTDAAYEQRANTILHELAHMWFGDLVTMTWWDDLWLNESFAEWASHHAMAEATDYTDAWVTFLNLRKAWAYRQDQLPSTHPIATDMVDLEAVKLNFDGITYAKGASALRQLVAWVGVDNFLTGLRSYFRAHAWANTTLADLLVELEATSGRDLGTWTQQWLRTAGVNLLRPVVEVADGRYTRVAIVQEPPALPAGLDPVLRSHRLRVGCYTLSQGPARMIRTGQVELDVDGAITEVPDLVGTPVADLLLVNDDDLTFAKIRLDEHSLATARDHLGALDDPMPRTLVWGAAWDMTRDGEITTGDYLALARAGLPAETDIGVVSQVLRQARTAIELFAAPEHIAGYREHFATFLTSALMAAEPGSDHQLAYMRALAGSARARGQLDLISGLLSGDLVLEGLTVDTDLRWTLLSRLVALGLAGPDQIDAELARDATASGQRQAVTARASIPTTAAKRAAWETVVHDLAQPNAVLEATMAGLSIPEQRELLEPLAEEYFEVIEGVWASRSHEMAAMVAHGLYPNLVVSEALVARARQFLARPDLPAGLRRVVAEGCDAVERSLRCQARDARG